MAARRLADGSIALSDGRIVYADTPVSELSAQDICEIVPLCTGGGGGGGGGLAAVSGMAAIGGGGGVGPPGPPGPPGIDGVAGGGSGATYESLQEAVDGETATEETIVPQAGTAAGVVVGPATLSPVDDFYVDYYVVNTDVTPSNGLVSQWARVSDYDGATRTLTLDKPWDFSAESDVTLVLPARVWLYKDNIPENITIDKSIELNLEGHRVDGEVNISGGIFQWIRGGSGFITSGVEKTNFGVLRVDEATISRRDEAIYALLITEGSNLGRCELMNCRFMGRVSGRRGYMGWNINGCQNVGVPSQSGTENFAYTLVESVAGVAIVLSAVDICLDTEIGGAFVFSENSITGASAYMSIVGTARCPVLDPGLLPAFPGCRHISIFAAAAAATLSVTYVASGNTIEFAGYRPQNGSAQAIAEGAVVYRTFRGFSGTLTVVQTAVLVMVSSEDTAAYVALIDGAATSSGTITISGSGTINWRTPRSAVTTLRVNNEYTGTTSIGTASVDITGGVVVTLDLAVSQTSGAPSITISAPITVSSGISYRHFRFGAATFTVGTWTLSGVCFIQVSQTLATGVVATVAGVQAGTILISGSLRITYIASAGSYNHITHVGVGGAGASITLSGVNSMSQPTRSSIASVFTAINHTGTSGTVVISGSFFVSYWGCGVSGSFRLTVVTMSGGTANITGLVMLDYVYVEGSVTLINPNAAGSASTGPTQVQIQHCTFLNTFTTSSGSGTVTWANAVLVFRHTHMEGLFTLIGTHFANVTAWLSTFNGNSSNNSISFSGTRPTTYRLWKCVFNGIPNAAGTPEIIDDYVVRPAVGALAKGNLLTINAAGQAAAMGAASVLEGVSLEAAAGAGSRTVMVRRGTVFVDSQAGVVAGDNCNADVAGVPTQQITAAAAAVGIRSARALEAAGATVAGEAYSVVNLM